MKGSEAKLVSYMQGANKRFIIPVYQRKDSKSNTNDPSEQNAEKLK